MVVVRAARRRRARAVIRAFYRSIFFQAPLELCNNSHLAFLLLCLDSTECINADEMFTEGMDGLPGIDISTTAKRQNSN